LVRGFFVTIGLATGRSLLWIRKLHPRNPP
jgi:hypothetical protein